MHNERYHDLIIGETSQISKYLNPSITRISARNVPEHIFHADWNRVYVCFAEQRTIHAFDSSYKEEFYKTNVDLTMSIIEKIKSKKIVYFSTVELWGKHSGAISLDIPFNFEENYYTVSKHEATKRLMHMEHVMILYPFNFNSRHRDNEFLMGKIFQSLICKKKIEVGNLDWNRDMLHAIWVAKQATIVSKSAIIGSGTYFNVKKYVKDLYRSFEMNFDDFVVESSAYFVQKNLTYLQSNKVLYTYDQLLTDTVSDLHQPIA